MATRAVVAVLALLWRMLGRAKALLPAPVAAFCDRWNPVPSYSLFPLSLTVAIPLPHKAKMNVMFTINKAKSLDVALSFSKSSFYTKKGMLSGKI